ncbi:MAG: hypothetical protein A2033_01905 [Bacteroidetes bacterium GWA2_31_9]|nr:MAG: hypothetical protein A2033_01905 [Bacteroidetes bacterium GWA2_31_9]
MCEYIVFPHTISDTRNTTEKSINQDNSYLLAFLPPQEKKEEKKEESLDGPPPKDPLLQNLLDSLEASDAYYAYAQHLRKIENKYDDALLYYKKSLSIAKKNHNIEQEFEITFSIGATWKNKGKPEKALEIYKELEKMALTHNINPIELYNNIAIVYETLQKPEDAKEYYKKALKLSEETNDEYNVAVTLINLGSLELNSGNLEDALDYSQTALKYFESINHEIYIAMCNNNIGNVLIQKGKYQESLPYLLKSLNIFQESSDNYSLALIYNNIGRVYMALDNYPLALDYLEKALNYARQVKSPNLFSLIYENFSIIYEQTNNTEQAFQFYKLFKAYNDTVKDVERIKIVEEAEKKELKAKTATLQKDNELQEERIAKQKFMNKIITGGIGFLGIFTFFLVKSLINRRKMNKILSQQKKELEHKDKETTDSITYAKRIQEALLWLEKELMEEELPNNFRLYQPKDIVSGDFYWMHKKDKKLMFTAADCTGHGVPGAFVTMLGISSLYDIVKQENCPSTASGILDKLRSKIINVLSQTGKEGEQKDGMDMSFGILDTETKVLEYAGANNPLYIIRNGELIEYKADKMPIGIYGGKENTPFTNHTIQLEKGDSLYMFSDGYVDQFGGSDGKKFKSKHFKELLLSIQDKPMEEQKEILLKKHLAWKQEWANVLQSRGKENTPNTFQKIVTSLRDIFKKTVDTVKHKEKAEQTDDIVVLGMKM